MTPGARKNRQDRGTIPGLSATAARAVLTDLAREGLDLEADLNQVFGAIAGAAAGKGALADACQLFAKPTARIARGALFQIQDMLLAGRHAGAWPDAEARDAGTAGLWPPDKRILRDWIEDYIERDAKPATLKTWLSCLRSFERLRQQVAELQSFPSNLQPNAIFDQGLDRAIKAYEKRVGAKPDQAHPIRLADLRRLRARILDEDLPAARQAWEDDRVEIEAELQDLLADKTRAILKENGERRALGFDPLPLPKVDLSGILPAEPLRLMRRAIILGLGYNGLLRPAEAMALRVGDFWRLPHHDGPDELLCVIRRSKRDQIGIEQPDFVVDAVTAELLLDYWQTIGIAWTVPAGAALGDDEAAGTPYALPWMQSVLCGPGKRVEKMLVEHSRPMSQNRFGLEVQAAAAADPDLAPRSDRISGYSLRVGAALTLAEESDEEGRGIALNELMDQMRHSSPTVTMRYLKQAGRRAVQRRFTASRL
jgi:integrase